MKNKIDIPKNRYSFIRDEKNLSAIFIIIATTMSIFAWVKVPFLTTIHAYTVGVIFGSFNPFFYVYIIYRNAMKFFSVKNKFFARWIKLNHITYWFVAFSLIMVFTTYFHYIPHFKISSFGKEQWVLSFNDWWNGFIHSSDGKNLTWCPENYWGGVVSALTFSIFSSISTPIGAGIIAIVFLCLSISLLITGSTIGLYKSIINKHRMKIKKTEVDNASFVDIDETFEDILDTKELLKNDEQLPFDDPFPTGEIPIIKNDDLSEDNSIKEEINNDDFEFDIDIPNSNEQIKSDEDTLLIEEVQDVSRYDEYSISSTAVFDDLKIEPNDDLKIEIEINAEKLNQLFVSFNIQATVVNYIQGPTITKYIVQPEMHVNIKKFTSIEQNIKMVLAAKDVRMELPIPGQSKVGIEVPNKIKEMVRFKTVYDKLIADHPDNKMMVSIGQDIEGNGLSFSINKTPHMLIAGATGSGKSVGINSIIVSLLMRNTPNELQFILVDPKMVEFSQYKNIPHLMKPVITQAHLATEALDELVEEMELRYQKLADNGVRNIEEFNNNFTSPRMPYIVCIIDELADLMNVASKSVEVAIQRLTQKSRAAGIHLILATQRPSVNVVTGIIKSNVPTRIAFSVSSSIDSKVILDSTGAEKLMGQGDMLVSLYGQGIIRAQGAYLSNKEINNVIKGIKKLM